MKRKGNRDIPDFSKKRVSPTAPSAPGAKTKAPAPPTQVRAKPHSTSSKSGQRGR
jgi:hypothetical protein